MVTVASVLGNVVQAAGKDSLKKDLEAARAQNSALLQDKADRDFEIQRLQQENQQFRADLQAARHQASQYQKEFEREKQAHAETLKLVKKAQDEAAQAKAENATLRSTLKPGIKESGILTAKSEEQKTT